MSMQNQLEREIESIEESVNNGQISQRQANKEINIIEREYRSAAEESAMEAYDEEMERW